MTISNGTEVTETGLEAFKVLDLILDKKDGKYYLVSGSYPTRWPHRKEIVAVCSIPDNVFVNSGAFFRSASMLATTPRAPIPNLYEEEDRGPVPHQGHMCGIHASKEAKQCFEYIHTFANEDDERLMLGSVLVKLSLWGRVLEGTLGFRAAKAYPTAIYIPSNKVEEIGAPLCDSYGCKIITEEDGPDAADILEQLRRRSVCVVNKEIAIDTTIGVPLHINALASEPVTGTTSEHNQQGVVLKVPTDDYLKKVRDLINVNGELAISRNRLKQYPEGADRVDGEERDS
jgi:hypothetical protein